MKVEQRAIVTSGKPEYIPTWSSLGVFLFLFLSLLYYSFYRDHGPHAPFVGGKSGPVAHNEHWRPVYESVGRVGTQDRGARGTPWNAQKHAGCREDRRDDRGYQAARHSCENLIASLHDALETCLYWDKLSPVPFRWARFVLSLLTARMIVPTKRRPSSEKSIDRIMPECMLGSIRSRAEIAIPRRGDVMSYSLVNCFTLDWRDGHLVRAAVYILFCLYAIPAVEDRRGF